jgi:lipopolysaccharide transport system permease protein
MYPRASSAAQQGSPHRKMTEVIVLAGRHERHYRRDLCPYRELFEVLAWRHLSVLYKQNAIDVLWAIILPVLAVLVFTVIFGHIAKLPSEGATP